MVNLEQSKKDTTPEKVVDICSNDPTISLPVELLTESLSYSATWPTLFNLRNCCWQARAIVDKKLKSDLTFDTKRYSKLNINASLTDQMDYLLNECGHIFQRLTIAPCPLKYNNRLLSAVQMLLTDQGGQLTELVVTEPNLGDQDDWYQICNQLVDLIGQCNSLQSLKLPRFRYNIIPRNHGVLNLSALGSLEVLHGQFFQFGDCSAQLTELNLIGSMYSVGMKRTDFEQLLCVVCPTIERLNLVLWTLGGQDKTAAKKSFLVPKLKWLRMNSSLITPIALDVSESGDLEHFELVAAFDDEYGAVAGFNPNKHKLKHFELGFDPNSTFYSKWCDADRAKFNMLEVLVVNDRSVSNDWLERLMKNLSYHCSSLCQFRLSSITSLGSWSMHSDWSDVVRLVSNAHNLNSLYLQTTEIGVDSLVKLVHAKHRVENNHYFDRNILLKFSRVPDATKDEFCCRLMQVLDNDQLTTQKLNKIIVRSRYSDDKVESIDGVSLEKLEDIGISVQN